MKTFQNVPFKMLETLIENRIQVLNDELNSYRMKYAYMKEDYSKQRMREKITSLEQAIFHNRVLLNRETK